jgi:hypothetical protein
MFRRYPVDALHWVISAKSMVYKRLLMEIATGSESDSLYFASSVSKVAASKGFQDRMPPVSSSHSH